MTKEEAIRELREDKALYETDNCRAGDGSPDGDLLEAIDMAIEALSADAVHGEWIKVEEQPYFRKHYDTVCCSVCRKKGNRKWNYCPSCGARMKGGDSE